MLALRASKNWASCLENLSFYKNIELKNTWSKIKIDWNWEKKMIENYSKQIAIMIMTLNTFAKKYEQSQLTVGKE